MKSFRPSARRLLSFAAAAAAGAAATLLVATPAFAHTSSVGGKAVCDQAAGEYVITWTITLTNDPNFGFRDVTFGPAGSTLTGIQNESGFPHTATTPITATQRVAGTFSGNATLNFTTLWKDTTIDDNNHGTVPLAGNCTPPYTVTQDCDKITFTFHAPQAATNAVEISITLTPNPGSPETFKIKTGDADVVKSFPASPGLTVEVKIGDFKKMYTWTHDPCPTTPSPSPSLPTTGSSLSAPLTVGGVLLVGGISLVGLVFAMRRRRSLAG